MEIRAVDIGFGFTKITDGSENRLFKSVYGEATEIQYREQLLRDEQEPHLHVEVDGEGLFVGDMAERQSKVRAFTQDQNQFMSKFAKVLGLTGLAQLPANEGEPIGVITGLPIVYYRQHMQDLSNLLLGRHLIKIIDRKGQPIETAINVEKVKVVPQPFGSVFDLIFDEKGQPGDKRYLEEKIGVIDIGFRTADFTICDRTRYSQRGSQTTDSGIGKAFAVIAAALQEQSGIDIEIYRLHEAIQKGSIKIRGKTYDLTKVSEHAFKQLATAVASEVDRAWTDDWDIDGIVLTGGGCAAIADHLTPLLQGEVTLHNADNDPRMNNARGYWKYGSYLWNR